MARGALNLAGKPVRAILVDKTGRKHTGTIWGAAECHDATRDTRAKLQQWTTFSPRPNDRSWREAPASRQSGQFPSGQRDVSLADHGKIEALAAGRIRR